MSQAQDSRTQICFIAGDPTPHKFQLIQDILNYFKEVEMETERDNPFVFVPIVEASKKLYVPPPSVAPTSHVATTPHSSSPLRRRKSSAASISLSSMSSSSANHGNKSFASPHVSFQRNSSSTELMDPKQEEQDLLEISKIEDVMMKSTSSTAPDTRHKLTFSVSSDLFEKLQKRDRFSFCWMEEHVQQMNNTVPVPDHVLAQSLINPDIVGGGYLHSKYFGIPKRLLEHQLNSGKNLIFHGEMVIYALVKKYFLPKYQLKLIEISGDKDIDEANGDNSSLQIKRIPKLFSDTNISVKYK